MFGGIGKFFGGLASKAMNTISFSDLAPTLLGGGLSLLGGWQRNRAARDVADRQMRFQAMMSGTAYQRAMADMRAAGLNPLLAYRQGGASSGAGAGVPPIDMLTPAVQSGLAARKQVQEYRNMKAQERIQKEEMLNKQQIGSNLTEQNEMLQNQKWITAFQRDQAKLGIKLLKNPVARKAFAAGQTGKWLNPGLQGVSSAKSIMSPRGD